MFYLFLSVSILIFSKISSCSNLFDNVGKQDDIINYIPEYESLDLFEEFEAESRSQNISSIVTENSSITPTTFTVAAIIGVPLLLTALAPPTLPIFPPQGAIQPGSVTEGGGVLPTSAVLRLFSPLEEGALAEGPLEDGPLQVVRPLDPFLRSEVSLLASGLLGATILAVFSSSLPETFFAPRTLPATAILFKEPDDLLTARQNSFNSKSKRSCKKTILPLGRIKKSLSPLTKKISNVFQPISNLKSKFYSKAGLLCLVPKLLRPFHPLIEKIRCKLGLDEATEFMPGNECNPNSCIDPALETKIVTNDLGLPNTDFLTRGRVSTLDDCFRDMSKAKYGSRVRVKILDDVSCENFRYQNICEELIEQNLVLYEEDCRSPGCKDLADDPFKACFGCDTNISDSFQTNYDQYGNFYPDRFNDYEYAEERQTGEFFMATAQKRRLICRNKRGGRVARSGCRIRIDRLMQLRAETYGRAQQFIQSENYLSPEDVNIIR